MKNLLFAFISSIMLNHFELLKERDLRRALIQKLEMPDDVTADNIFRKVENQIIADPAIIKSFTGAGILVLLLAGAACKKNGVQFAYHNHQTEFDEVEGHRPFDYILNNTDKDLVKMELDLAWATKAKQDPVELFKLHPGRYPLWHVKDLDKTTLAPAEVGSGIVDFTRIFANAKESGMKYFFVEQDQAPQPFQNVTNSYTYLNKLLDK